MAALWPDTVVEENNLGQNISKLRSVLGESRGENRYIATAQGRGYRFVADVKALTDENGRGAAEAVPSETINAPAEVVTTTPPAGSLGRAQRSRTDGRTRRHARRGVVRRRFLRLARSDEDRSGHACKNRGRPAVQAAGG
jgi:hypothetical protein